MALHNDKKVNCFIMPVDDDDDDDNNNNNDNNNDNNNNYYYYSWVARDVTKNQTKKLSILLSFYFHEVLQYLNTFT